MNPYYLMTLLYLALAALAALDTSLVNLQILPPFPGQRWLLVHTVALGALVELIFGVAPHLAARLARLPRPSFRWPTWFLLNSGLIVLYAGMPLVNPSLIIGGGALIFFAAIMLIQQLLALTGRDQVEPEPAAAARGVWFYVAGTVYLLVGIVVGTGLWLGWQEPLRMVTPKEVHVHSNLWGFTALVLAGLLIDLYPGFTGHPLARPRLAGAVFWLMAVGVLGLILGPWVDINTFTVVGLALHTVGTFMMLIQMIVPLWGKGREWTAGIWHLAAAYVWFTLAVVVAPLVVAGGMVGDEVAGSGGPILIFGWILQVSYALIPFLFARAFRPEQPARLGGSWFTLATMNGGALLYWLSLFFAAGRGPLRGIAYLLWIVSLVPILMDLANVVGGRFEQLAEHETSLSA